VNIPTRLAGLAGAALLTVLLAACDSDRGAEPVPPAGSAAASSAEAPGPVTVPEPGNAERKPAQPSTDHSLGDGTHEARIVDVDAAGGRVTVDVVDLLTGDEAVRAATAAGAEVPPPNDYYVRNVSSRLRTLPVAPAAPITVNVHGATETGSSTRDVSITLARLAALPDLNQGLFRLTVHDGQLTRIAEVYLP
jgi:hypothetical protein